jgi:hypothetical protein
MSTDCRPGVADYRRNAEDCLRLADRVSPETRAVLIMMAQAWLRLAEQREHARQAKPLAPVT